MSGGDFSGVEALLERKEVAGMRAAIAGGGDFALGGLKGPVIPFAVGLLCEGLHLPAFLVLSDEDDLDAAVNELKVWTRDRNVHPYPFVPPEITSLEHAPMLQQMKALRAMMEKDSPEGIWVATRRALAGPAFDLGFIEEPVLALETGQEYGLERLCSELEARGFSREERVEQKGDYARRGGIVDVFPRFAQHPLRLEFDGNALESIREFSAVTQKSLRRLPRFVLDDIELERLRAVDRGRPLADYVPRGSVFFLEEPIPGGGNPGSALGAPNSPESWEFVRRLLDKDSPVPGNTVHSRVFFGAAMERCIFDFRAELLDPEAMTMEGAAEFLEKEAAASKVFLLSDYASPLQLAGRGKSDLWSLEGPLSENFRVPPLGVSVFHERNLVQLREASLMEREAVMEDFAQFEPGDTVVHEQYGIGRFLGLKSLEKAGSTSDYMLLQFAGQTGIYVSVAQLGLVQKYIGRGEAAPELSRVGGGAWALKKKRARKAIDRIVMELVDRQAFREKQPGFAFSIDGREQRLFERRFPYAETACQAQAAAAIKEDMEKPKPMDHLLCGDVGFGKTEVAMRAAHKALQDGKQVAVLAPTTVLAEQHFRSFCRRFGEKAGTVGIVSRFHSAGENRLALARIASGELSVLVGTHRLLSQDVVFADLGLLILDEEQRFGVRQKERLKSSHPAVDVLSISATPIPRTLHLAMLGLRGISNLTVAPENRLPIRTYVREYASGVIRHAVERELARGGQTYFLHNRVEDIESMRAVLAELFPRARIAVGHGQMPEHELALVMQDFYSFRIDIFLATSIIANGIDIPTANTMIVNNAHLFGLSELHQIRGRIGRYNIQAYAYLLVPPGCNLPKTSLRRLRAIEEHQELGAGFKLAMRDMEIRGVGNILGEDQHGRIADIGYELYTQYLAQAIEERRSGQGASALRETELSWSVGSTYLPETYLPSHGERIEFYRRISFARDIRQLDRVAAEIKDRFGIMPRPALQLLRFFRCKARLRALSVKSLKKKGGGDQAVLEPFGWSDELKLAWVMGAEKELAFLGEARILMRVGRIWKRMCGDQEEREPFARFSYYSPPPKLDPLDALETVVDFCETSLEKAKKKTEGL